MKVETKCPECKKVTPVRISKEGYKKWKDGMLIQRAFPELSNDERELLISGYCQECWDKLWKECDASEVDLY